MKSNNWPEIRAHYRKAKECFWCPANLQNWHRDDENGYYHLWTAYHMAQEMEEKDHLWYARLLYMMANELRGKFYVFTLLHRYAEPMMTEFSLAKQAGEPPEEAEWSAAQKLYDWMAYEVECCSYETNPVEQSVSRIENHELLEQFGFHDSLPVFFQQDDHSALLKLQYNEWTAALEFEDVYEIHVDGDPACSYVLDFFCYPDRKGDNSMLVFDIGAYKITCKKIRVLSVEKE